MKKVLGYLLFVVAGILTLSILFQLSQIIKSLIALFMTLLGKAGAYDFGYAIGLLTYHTFLIVLVIFLFKKGKKLIASKPTP